MPFVHALFSFPKPDFRGLIAAKHSLAAQHRQVFTAHGQHVVCRRRWTCHCWCCYVHPPRGHAQVAPAAVSVGPTSPSTLPGVSYSTGGNDASAWSARSDDWSLPGLSAPVDANMLSVDSYIARSSSVLEDDERNSDELLQRRCDSAVFGGFIFSPVEAGQAAPFLFFFLPLLRLSLFPPCALASGTLPRNKPSGCASVLLKVRALSRSMICSASLQISARIPRAFPVAGISPCCLERPNFGRFDMGMLAKILSLIILS